MKNKYKILLLIVAVIALSAMFTGFTTASAAEVCEHEFDVKNYAATCTEGSKAEYTCKLCGYSYVTVTGEKLGHEFKTVTVDATCTHKGYTTNFCTVCGYMYTDNYTDETGHSYTAEVIAPDCVNGGYTKHVCGDCGFTYLDEITDKQGHNYTGETVEPDCLTGGYTTYTCAVCGDSYVGDYTDKLGHAYVDETVKATCIGYGYTSHTCSRCGDRYVTDYVAPLDHEYTVEKVLSERDGVGYIMHTCNNCSYSYISDLVANDKDGFPPEEMPVTHTHEYHLDTKLNEETKTVRFVYSCACGDGNTEALTVYISQNGEKTAVEVVGGTWNYAGLTGKYNVEVVDGDKVLSKFTLTATADEEPIVPDVPVVNPDDGDEPIEGHEHKYNYFCNKDYDNKTLTFSLYCDCGDRPQDELTVTIFDGTESKSFTVGDGSVLSYADIYGSLSVTVSVADGAIENFTLENRQSSGEHEHLYTFEYKLDKESKTINVKCGCISCNATVPVVAEFVVNDNKVVLEADANGNIYYGQLDGGKYAVSIRYENVEFTTLEVEAEKSVQQEQPGQPEDKPVEEKPGNTDNGEQKPDDTQVGGDEQSDEQEPADNSKKSTTVILCGVGVVVLLAGGIVTVVLLKKKKKN